MNGGYIFQEPSNKHFLQYDKSHTLWKKFAPYELIHNHRQGEDGIWADCLNRFRLGTFTEDDIKVLISRITKEKFLDSSAMHVMYTKKEVNKHNEDMLKTLESAVVILEAKRNKSLTWVDKDGYVNTTNFKDILKLKKEARVALVFNINTVDELVNGGLGTVIGFEHDKSGNVIAVIVKLDDENAGLQQRKEHSKHSEKYKDQTGTPIYKHKLRTFSRNKETHIEQFPLSLAWASTSHRMQVNKHIYNFICIYTLILFFLGTKC